MASPILHIKDCYYFEVPKALWRWNAHSRSDFPKWWIQNDPGYRTWEAHQIYHGMEHHKDELFGEDYKLPSFHELEHEYQHWQHEDHANFSRPFDDFLRTQAWFQKFDAQPEFQQHFAEVLAEAKSDAAYQEYLSDPAYKWSPEKIEAYSHALDGKILIPQPFAELRNGYQVASGFGISKFMILEVVVALILVALFGWLAQRVKSGAAPKGRLWNLLEAILVFMRDEVARPAIGKHDADRFVPLLWTIFLFVLGCNLMGMVPWAGSPTGTWAVTGALAIVTFSTVIVSGSFKFGPIGFWMNQIPSMDLPLAMAIFIKPVIFVIEVAGLFIKHTVLSVRLLANMVAGHLVLLSIMGLAFSIEAAASATWWVAAPSAVFGSTLLSCLELFVAFLQAYIFAFLSALFIGAAVHHH